MAISAGNVANAADISSIYTEFNTFINRWRGYGGTNIAALSSGPSAGALIDDSNINTLNSKIVEFQGDTYLKTQPTFWKNGTVSQGVVIKATDLNFAINTKANFASVKCRNTATNSKGTNSVSCSYSTNSNTCSNSTNSNTCSNTCSVTCSNACSNTCSNTCSITCSNTCSITCSNTCSQSCTRGSYGTKHETFNSICAWNSCGHVCNKSGYPLSYNTSGCCNKFKAHDGLRHAVTNFMCMYKSGGTKTPCGWTNWPSNCTRKHSLCSPYDCNNACSQSCSHSSHSQSCSNSSHSQSCNHGTHSQSCSHDSHSQACSNSKHNQTCSNSTHSQTCSKTCSKVCSNTTTIDILCSLATKTNN